jgi:ABC-type multidrug transport system ATPase subunit
MSDQLAIEARGIEKSFGAIKAVDGIDLNVKAETVHGFLGPNGAGKTTVIRILLGLLAPESAEIAIFGRELPGERKKILQKVGGIVEAPVLFPYLTAYENLQYLSNLSGGANKKLLEETLEVVGLTNARNRKAREFSYGMKQRLGIAQALLPDNKLIFLDEPVNGLDPHGIVDMRRLIRSLCEERGITVFLSSHLLSEVEHTCDYVTIIRNGAKVTEEKMSDLMVKNRTIEIETPDADSLRRFLDERGEKLVSEVKSEFGTLFRISGELDEIPGINKMLVEKEIKVFKIGMHQKVLEEIFVELTS